MRCADMFPPALAAVALAVIVLLAVAEVAVFCVASGHSFAHVISLGMVPDHPMRPL